MKNNKFKYQFWGIVMIILFLLTLYFLYWSDKYQREQDTVPLTEEEKEMIDEDAPRGVPTRFWN